MEIQNGVKFNWNPTLGERLGFILSDFLETKNMKYDEETKTKCVKLAQEGVALKTIQQKVGPNPKAVQRYLLKAGINYIELRKKLIAEGKLKTGAKKNPAAAAVEKKK